MLWARAPPKPKRETIQALAKRIPFDPSAFLQLLDIRERKAETKQSDVNDVFTRYLKAVQQVTDAVDKMLDSLNHAVHKLERFDRRMR